ncbi:protein translocase subunit SecD [Oryzihumus leptocrescens]|uniref:Protein translocase subunit SecD n=1 Tax=Oryzihumus leptocrescens TaxID=297536 RepID=A0A542ZJ60_9MICO|nr:protein translocase subunit SecD [Oryzihumus leptocrescens]TQL60384.1 preprotein translocase subunit SecD [Oryzihumus leptocrescens]
MAINPRNRKPLRTLAALAVLIVGLYGLLAAVVTWGSAQWTPKLGLDLEGGTQLILKPVITNGGSISQDQINQAVDIMRQRVDSTGVSEAEVTTQGGSNVVVSLPGTPDKATIDSLKRSSQLRFRAVLVEAAGAPQPTPTSTGTATAPSGTPSATPSSGSKATAPAGTATTSAKSAFPPALSQDTTPTPTPSATGTTGSTGTTGTKPKDASDLAWITPDIEKQFTALNCSDKAVEAKLATLVDDPAKPLVTCSQDRTAKYILGPAEVVGTDIADATSGFQTTQQGAQTNQVEIQLKFDSNGTKKFGDVTSRLVSLPQPRNQFAIVLDSQVLSAPVTQSAITAGTASITGNFTEASAKTLADQLKFGALPMSFTPQTEEQVSPTLGTDQLQKGLLAGLIGLLLVVIYSLFQYRALGFVTVASLVIASLLTYVTVALLGWSHGFRLTLAGVTGLIVSIGITADSFIVFFERVRDEVREGRLLRQAVETGWARARRTILVADGVNMLAAMVLYILATSNVRGFAFTLMLTTIIDVAVVFLFTHPIVAILANTKFFGEGHKWSGFDPERLGAKQPLYAGRGRVTIAARRAAEESAQS